ncbi:MAG TPA: hypothetical protein VMT00_03495 [Thermoanaerobaculia bacterium]|nr:hypothetical protein [Thermoanaerobaculia bacterium]
MMRCGAIAAGLALALAIGGCTGGQEGSASDAYSAEDAVQTPDPIERIRSISGAIPVYQGAEYRPDLSRRDETVYRGRYGPQTEVFTLATPDSFPQVWHYYVTYLAQFRAFDPVVPLPPKNQTWRTIEIPLSHVMQDPFIPGEDLQQAEHNVMLQVIEQPEEPVTIIRYVINPAAPRALVPVVAETESAESVPAAR